MNFLTTKITSIYNEKGFTLTELLIVVAIIGILTLIAYPTYQSQMLKTRRSDAKIALTEMANREEKFFSNSDSPHYTGTITGSFTGNPPTGLGYTSTLSPQSYYTLSIAAATTGNLTTSFIATANAVATGAQARDTTCSTMTIDNTGTKAPLSGCW